MKLDDDTKTIKTLLDKYGINCLLYMISQIADINTKAQSSKNTQKESKWGLGK